MQLPGIATAGLEQTIQALLALDPVARQQLAELHGRTIAIALRGIGLTLYFVPGENGNLQLLSTLEGEPDVTISGSPLSLMQATDTENSSTQLFAGDMQIEGDTELAHQFSRILGGLDIDWEEHLSRVVGDLAAHRIGLTARQVGETASRGIHQFEDNLAEYVTEEAELLPPRLMADEFLEAVDTLRDDVERLAARIALIQHHGSDT
ncbi:MAG: ubiquinone biosynthesis accessory factor UbiJ [bacterium]